MPTLTDETQSELARQDRMAEQPLSTDELIFWCKDLCESVINMEPDMGNVKVRMKARIVLDQINNR